jgi:L-alanine-DL-glutamate epimerase-like enolase superfamily enzyme
MLKRVILGENPCNVHKVFRKIKQFGGHTREGGGVCGVEMTLWDIAGKVYNAPVYQLLGGTFRDNVRCYADTTQTKDAKLFAKRLKERVVQKGFTFLKMGVGVGLVED